MSKLNSITSFFLKKLSIPFVGLLVFNSGYSQVNLQTGSATFSIPMFNWQDHKSNLTTTVGLSYNSGNGLKVSDVASEVGQGWQLIAGGVITRMQVGEPDDQIKSGSETDEKDIYKYPSGYLYAANKAYNGCPEALTKYPIYKEKNQLYKQHNSVTEDRELDYFAFQFNGKSGMFILNAAPDRPNGLAPEDIGITLGDTKLKIKFQRDLSLSTQGIRTSITSFTIQDVDGLIYKFSKHGITQLLETKYTQPNGIYPMHIAKFSNGKVYYQSDFENNAIPNKFIIGSWYLTEIKDPLTLRTVTLNYNTQYINNPAGTDFSYNQDGDYSTVSYKRSITQTPQLASIAYPDGHTVIFHHTKARVDFLGANALTAVDIKYGSRYISKYLINTTYFILNRYGTPVSDYQKKVARLCLKSVQKIGVDLKEDSPPYIFDYYTGSNTEGDYVPPPFWWKKDVWGYYNADKSKNTHGGDFETNSVEYLDKDDIVGLCFQREIAGQNNTYTPDFFNVKPGYAKNGLLRQIIYPTGGTLTYEYQQNEGYVDNVYRTVGGVHVSQTSSTDGGYSNNCSNPVTTLYNYVLNQTGSPSSLWGLEMPVNHVSMSSFYEPLEKYYKFPVFGGCGLFGCCKYKWMYPGILSIQQATSLSEFMQLMQTISPVLGIVGTVSTVLNAIKVIAGATGVGAIISLMIDVIVGYYTIIQSCLSNQSKTVNTNIYYNFDLNSASPLPAQFKRVEIVENPGTVGKTVHEFTSDEDYPVWELTNEAFTTKQRFASWAYGLPKSTTVFKQNGDIVKQTINEYDATYLKYLIGEYNWHHGPPNASGLSSNFISCKCAVTKTSSQKSTEWVANNPGSFQTGDNGDMKVKMHGYYTGRLNLSKVKERVYNESNPTVFAETTTSFFYNVLSTSVNYPGNYEVSEIKTESSNGDVTVKTIAYSGTDYNGNDPVIPILLQNNIVALPVQTSTYVSKGTVWNPQRLSDNRTEFIQLGTGVIKPLRILEKRFTEPTADPNTVNYIEVKKFTYDAQGNLIGVNDEGGRTVTNLYDHDDKYSTATVINADVTTTKVAHTSFETANFGGWIVSGIISYTNTFKITGDRSCQLNAGSSVLTANSLNQNLNYRLSFWATEPLSVSGGGTLILSEPTLNGFTYYEYEFPTGVSSITLMANGNGQIDELRLYPKGARMSSVTYDPLLGKTSECDENNRITYYEYDDLGRMRFIKDEMRSIVKMYEYNNVSKQAGCPGIYYSRYTDEIFTKNNCGAGFIGSEVHYTIPANKYTSTISQEDADAQVHNELMELGQAYANTNGTCIPLYCNTVQSLTVYSEDCPPGYKGGAYTYTVPAGRYCTTESQAVADQWALDEIDANAQAFVNNPPNIVCVPDYDPDWQAEENAPTECRWVNGQAYIFILATDVNPNSSSYGQTQWMNTEQPGNCPQPACNYSNCGSIGDQYRCINDNCEAGIRIYTANYYDTSLGQWVCVYHYEWSDGSWSGDYYDGTFGGNCFMQQ